MKLFVLILLSFAYSLPNVEFYFRTQHPSVRFHRKRLKAAKGDLQRQIDEFSLSNRVKYTDLTMQYSAYYSRKCFQSHIISDY